MTGWQVLWRVELPLSLRSILAGIKTAAVINIGMATLGALIGAGGYGQPILTGIRLDDMGLILEGALPAAGLAIAMQGLFELVERFVVPRGLRAGADARGKRQGEAVGRDLRLPARCGDARGLRLSEAG